MHDDEVGRLIDRIVTTAHIPRPAVRAELRRELRAHFEDAAAAGTDPADAIRRFGGDRQIVAAFRRVYAVEYALLYVLKLAVSIAAALAAALTIELAANIRIQPRPLLFAMAVVVTIVTAWELARPPAHAIRAVLARRRVFLIFVLFAALEFSIHLAAGVPFGARRAALAGVVLTMVSIATIAILARLDRAFVAFFET